MIKKKTSKYKKSVNIIAWIGFVMCALMLLYPVFSDGWNRYRESQLISDYNANINENTTLDDNTEAIDSARKYNELLESTTSSIITNAEYETDDVYDSLLDLSGTGMMGYLEIPCIDLTESIYHYSTEEVLGKGVGHVHGSSLPVGGSSTHAVLTGHRGLTSQKMFSDLDKIEIGDFFYVHILNNTFAYEVFEVKTVSPGEVESLVIEKEKDLVTLVTCTPYGVNTERLLVSGKRVTFDESNVDDGGFVTTEEHKRYIDPALAVMYVVSAIIVIFVIIIAVRKNKKAGTEKKLFSKNSTDHIGE